VRLLVIGLLWAGPFLTRQWRRIGCGWHHPQHRQVWRCRRQLHDVTEPKLGSQVEASQAVLEEPSRAGNSGSCSDPILLVSFESVLIQSGPHPAVATTVGAAGGGAGRGSVPQVAVVAVGADEGDAGGSSGPHMAMVPAAREADGDVGRGSDP
jgi:hypothetical protein